ncbi:MAG: ABC transporter substrate-binding protein [Roseiflexaceae bacterium]
MSTSSHALLNRRAFLKTSASIAGIAAAATLLPSSDTTRPISASLTRSVASGAPLTIGVLLPRSASHPAVGQNVLAGMRLYADQAAGRSLRLVAEEIGVGQRDAYWGARKLLEQDHVDLLAGVVNPGPAAGLHDLLHEHRAILTIADVGANVPRQIETHPQIFTSSLGYWQASHAMGSWAAQNLGRRAAVVTSFYDSGYDTIYAFRLGFESAGGQIAETFVSHRPLDSGDHMPALMAQIKAAQPDFVYAISSGREADAFLRAYADSGLAGRIPLAGASFTLAEQAARAPGRSLPDMPMVLPWAHNLGHAENQAFTTNYQSVIGRPADALALLGYDTAQLIDTAVAAAGDVRDTRRLQQALGQVAFVSPRGAVAIDPRTGSLAGPLYLGVAQQNGAGVRHVALEPISAPSEHDQQIAALRTSTKSGWINAYLCV